jgi:L-fucose mutarotase/ribose pyranase (RbsD/FucU family)
MKEATFHVFEIGSLLMDQLARKLTLLGHRNWIAIVDAAYPHQSRPGIETIVSDRNLLAEVRDVLGAIEHAPHLRAEVMLDAELPRITDADAPGIVAYRTQLKEALKGLPVRSMPHDSILARLHEVSQTYSVIVIKTCATLAYASVFIELHCGYWSQDDEDRLRASLPADFGA